MSVLNLTRLPKSKHIKSVNFKRTTPGSASPVIFPFRKHNRPQLVDPTHPLASAHPASYVRTLPVFTSPHLTVRAVPKALLITPDVAFPNPPFARKVTGHRRLDMSLVHVVLTNMHKSAFVRGKVKRRLKYAVALVLSRGADVEEHTSDNGKEREMLVSRKGDDSSTLLLDDWTYTFLPFLSVYRMPYTTLVPLVRSALQTVQKAALALEQRWASKSRALAKARRIPKIGRNPRGANATVKNIRDGPFYPIETRPQPDTAARERRHAALNPIEYLAKKGVLALNNGPRLGNTEGATTSPPSHGSGQNRSKRPDDHDQSMDRAPGIASSSDSLRRMLFRQKSFVKPGEAS